MLAMHADGHQSQARATRESSAVRAYARARPHVQTFMLCSVHHAAQSGEWRGVAAQRSADEGRRNQEPDRLTLSVAACRFMPRETSASGCNALPPSPPRSTPLQPHSHPRTARWLLWRGRMRLGRV